MTTNWIIRTDQPFTGIAQSWLMPDRTVANTETAEYRNGVRHVIRERLTPEEYARERNMPIRIIDDAEFDYLLAEYEASQVTAPAPITFARYWEMLEILPPCRYGTRGGVQLFHVSERIQGNLVNWFACVGSALDESSRFFTFVDLDDAPAAGLAAKVYAAL